LFLSELCDALEVPRPDQASHDAALNAYAFERAVTFREPDGSTAGGRIDLYKRGSFVLEAKQSRRPGTEKAAQSSLFDPEPEETAPLGRRTASRAWNILMLNARQQAEQYAKALPAFEGWPPFLIVCDVGHCFEIYADFTGQGKNYAQYPDRQGFRIYLEELRQEEIRERLRLIWLDPQKLDPAKIAAKVTREVAARLAKVSKHLEEIAGKDGKKRYDPETVALFLMRCLFTMFAEDVELLPKDSFREVLKRCKDKPELFPRLVEQLWAAMDKGGFAYAIERDVKQFNGYLFKNRTVLPLPCQEIGELYEAARKDWKLVEPGIFGTLLEQALNPAERKKLGAHYTPRAYVERLVVATILEPLKAEWANVQATAEGKRAEGDPKGAAAVVRSFHEKLCEIRILDPACGTGNFLYVSLELMKRLEGEVLDALASLAGQARFAGYELKTIDPHQFLGLEVNPRAAAIAELVLWIGYLQWHFHTRGGVPPEPILKDFKTIEVRDAVLAWDAKELLRVVTPAEAKHLGLGRRPGLENYLRQYRNGRDLTGTPRDVMVIDLFGLQADEVRKRFPEVYQHVRATVKESKDEHGRPNGRDLNNRESYRLNWWIFGEPRRELRPALEGLSRYIATVDTAKHRIFQILDRNIMCDDKCVLVACDDGFLLGVLSSRIHVSWSSHAGAKLEDRPVYSKSRVFDPFPFPDPPEALKARIRATAEELDALRKQVQAEHPGLTLTQIYNVLEKLCADEKLGTQDEAIKTNGLVLILKEHHETLDQLVAEAYGWPENLSDNEILAKIVALNAGRAAEEKRGLVRWLRPEYQRARGHRAGACTAERGTAGSAARYRRREGAETGLPHRRPGARSRRVLGVGGSSHAARRPGDRRKVPAGAKNRAFRCPHSGRLCAHGSISRRRWQDLRVTPERLTRVSGSAERHAFETALQGSG